MWQRALAILAGVVALACDNGVGDRDITEPPPRPSFVLFGTVSDEAGLPLPGADVEIAAQSRVATSNDDGFFVLTGVSGPATVRVRKAGYHGYKQDLVVVSDQLLEVTLSKLEHPYLLLGETIRARVLAGDPPCDPIGWDANAPCLRFGFTAPETGTLEVTVSWRNGSPLDAAIMAPDGSYLAFSRETGLERIAVDAPVRAGSSYELRVNSYYGAQEFDLKTTLTTNSPTAPPAPARQERLRIGRRRA